MLRILLVTLVALFVTSTAFARNVRRPSSSTDPTNLEATFNERAHGQLFSIDVAMADFAGTAYPGAFLSFVTHVTRTLPLYLGCDFGVFITPSEPLNAVFPILPALRFEFETASKWRPLLGLSAGPVISTGTGATTIRFGMLVSPGVNVTVTNSAAVHFELRAGMIGTGFVHIPAAGMTLTL